MIRLCLFCTILCAYASMLYAQNTSDLLIQIFEEGQNEMNYSFNYEFYGEGENMIDKTVITNKLTFEKTSHSGDTITIRIKADSTAISNPKVLQDGEVSLLYAMIGLDMELQIWAKGDSANILNKAEVVKEFEQGITGHSPDSRKAIVNNMLTENEALFYENLYKVNYAPILKYLGKTISFPMQKEQDSIIHSGPEHPKTNVRIIKTAEVLPKMNRFTTTTVSKSDPFTQENASYTVEGKESSTNFEELLNVSKSGQIQSVEVNSVQENQGFKIIVNGEVVQEMSPIKQYLKIRINQLE